MEEKDKKYLGEVFENTRQLVSFLNNNNIKKDDILSIYPKDDYIILIYYGREL